MKVRSLAQGAILAAFSAAIAGLGACGGDEGDDKTLEGAKAPTATPWVEPANTPNEKKVAVQPTAEDFSKMTRDQRAKEAVKAEQAGDTARAEQLHIATVNELRAGPKDWRYPTAVRALAFFYNGHAMYDKAEATFKEFIKAQEEVVGPDHAYVSDALIDLTGVYTFQKKDDLALPLYARALAIREKTDGPNSVPVARILKYQAETLKRMNRADEAAPLLERAQKIESGEAGASAAPAEKAKDEAPAGDAAAATPAAKSKSKRSKNK